MKKSIDQQSLLESLIEQVKAQISWVQNSFVPLRTDELKHKPEPKQWGIIDCIEHINIANQYYLLEFEKAIPQYLVKHKTVGKFYRPGYIGNFLCHSMGMQTDGRPRRAMKTLKAFEPKTNTQSKTPDAVLELFLTQSNSLINYLEQAKKVDLAKVRITSALGPIIRFKLGDAFRFVVTHSERHLHQAEKLKN